MVSPYSLYNWAWSPNFVYKLYTDVVIFYSWLAGIVAFAAAARCSPKFRMLLHRRVQGWF